MAVPERFREIVGGASGAAGALGVPGAFSMGMDVPFLLGIWGVGFGLIAEKAGHPSSPKRTKALLTSTLAGVVTFLTGSKIVYGTLNALPGLGTAGAIGLNSSANAFFTYRFLRGVAKVYDQCDSEEMAWQNLQTGLYMFSVLTIPSDIKDMADCIACGKDMIDSFKA